mgnify:CR=1 FL=1
MFNSTTEKAKVAPVKLTKDIVIEGLQLSDGTYGIAIPEIADMLITEDEAFDGFKTTKRQFSKTLKRLCGNVATLEEFEAILVKLDRLGNLQAKHIRDELTLVGLSIFYNC